MNHNVKDDLQHIRQMMEQSSRFLSLSGLSGVVAGIIALAGTAIVFYIFQKNGIQYFDGTVDVYTPAVRAQLVIIAIIVLIAAVGMVLLLTIKRSRKLGLKIWGATSKKVLQALSIPLIAGGIFCLAMIYHGQYNMVAPATLIFYGLALISASRYTYTDIQNLGYCEVILGLIALFLPGYGLIFWAAGFGILHIFYGLLMHKKYE